MWKLPRYYNYFLVFLFLLLSFCLLLKPHKIKAYCYDSGTPHFTSGYQIPYTTNGNSLKQSFKPLHNNISKFCVSLQTGYLNIGNLPINISSDLYTNIRIGSSSCLRASSTRQSYYTYEDNYNLDTTSLIFNGSICCNFPELDLSTSTTYYLWAENISNSIYWLQNSNSSSYSNGQAYYNTSGKSYDFDFKLYYGSATSCPATSTEYIIDNATSSVCTPIFLNTKDGLAVNISIAGATILGITILYGYYITGAAKTSV